MIDNNYTLEIKKKEDIIAAIRKNITDGEILDSIISNLEIITAKSISEMNNTIVPYVGSVRLDSKKLSVRSNAQILKKAREELGTSEYYAFRRELTKSELKSIDHNKWYRWFKSVARNKNRQVYLKYLKTHGENYANLKTVFSTMIISVYEDECE